MIENKSEVKYDIFISYSREDDKARPIIDRLRQDLEAAGKKVWWDKTCMESRGRSFLVELRDAIWDSERLIAVVGPGALRSKYVLQEWAYAYHFSKAIVPILHRGSYKDIPYDDAAILWRDEYERLPGSFDATKLMELHCPDFTENTSYRSSFDELVRILDSKLISQAEVLGEAPAFPPPNFMPRRSALQKLAELRMIDPKDPRSVMREMRIMVIHGAGGTGKSVLANAIAHSAQARWTFQNGIIWLRIGKPQHLKDTEFESTHVFRALKTLGLSLKKNINNYYDVRSAKQQLKETLAEKRCLLILDDVYDSTDAQDFVDILGRGCSLFITTRNKAIVSELSVPHTELISLGNKDLVLRKGEAKQLLADWAGQRIETLPPEADKVVDICNRLPLAMAICGATIRNGFPWVRLKTALLEAKERIVEARLPAYKKQVVSVFSPIQVSLDYLKELDEEDLRTGKQPIHRFEQYLDLSVLRGGVQTPEDVISALWVSLRNTDEDMSLRLLAELDSWALLRLVGDKQPYAYVLLHELQTAYLQKIVDDRELEILHREFGRALYRSWKTGMLVEGRPLDEIELRQEKSYCQHYLLQHLVEGKCWEELEQLLKDPSYLESRHDKEGQFRLEGEIASLLQNDEAPIGILLSGVLTGITKDMPLGREQADWLDTFAYWLNKYGKKDGQWITKELKNNASQFDDACGQTSQQLVEKYLQEDKQDWALRYAELSAWAYQRNSDFQSCVKACEVGEQACATEGLEKGYQILGKVEFIRMRARALSALFKKNGDAEMKGNGTAHIDKTYDMLSEEFFKIGPGHWLLNKKEWERLEEDDSTGFTLSYRKKANTPYCFKAVVVSNAHDAISSMYIIQSLEKKGGYIDWLHHNEFPLAHEALKESAMVVLIGGPKSPGIAEVTDHFLREDRENYLRMYSGLYFGPSQLKAFVDGTPYIMLGGVSKAHTLLAVYNFAHCKDLDDMLNNYL
jgi:hypothetical protein